MHPISRLPYSNPVDDKEKEGRSFRSLVTGMAALTTAAAAVATAANPGTAAVAAVASAVAAITISGE